MSRLIIKNLPKKISSDRLKGIFVSKGEVTDVQLKFNSKGSFRQFAFVGFKTKEQAEAAKEYFHDTFIDSSKIKIETCQNIGSTEVKAWSKQAREQTKEDELLEQTQKKKKKKKKSVEDNTPDDLKDDPQFMEFLSLHKNKTSWADSDLIKNESLKPSGDANESEEDDDDAGENDEIKPKINSQKTTVSAAKKTPSSKKKAFDFDDSCSVKVRDLPQGCKKSQIKKFFHPLKIVSLRLPPRVKGMAYVRFKTERDMKQALNKHRGFLDGNRLSVKKFTPLKPHDSLKTEHSAHLESEADPLIETGRIFVRNLCYTTTENEIETLFKTFGPVTEVHLPLDAFTRKLKGFAFVTFMFSEHAVKAFSALDGSSFQGRTLHLLPAKCRKSKEEKEELNGEDTSFKKKKANELKVSSGSWHNWNTLFLGANAVADVMAEKYNTSKSKLLDAGQKSSVAVTMALGETQIVSETREFLVNQGVHLEAFQNPQMERSKTVILVKNLPANTKEHQIREVFSVHGEISRLLLPPSGVTAIVEFQHPTEAKLAFRKLAYSRFQHVPLYLEWAPVNALADESPTKASSKMKEEPKDTEHDSVEESLKVTESDVKIEVKEGAEEEEEEVEAGTVLFVKNLNFETREEALKTHFKTSGKVFSASIAQKPDPRNPGQKLSMGYGFVQFKKKSSASKALKEMQGSLLDGHKLELKMSNKDTLVPQGQRKVTKPGEQKSTKILVRNIPFEASKREIKEIFSVFGELKALRLPSKITGEHRGFGFVDYLTRHDAKRAMASLGASTHVFGRRLVLEWAEADDTENVDVLRKKTARQYEHHSPGVSHKRLKDSLPQELDDHSS